MHLGELSNILEEISRTADRVYYDSRYGTDEEANAKATRDIANLLKKAVDNRISKQKSNSIPKILKT